jgi:DNA-directed RNA polymerase sigma subunit (sigma70/sigma32)
LAEYYECEPTDLFPPETTNIPVTTFVKALNVDEMESLAIYAGQHQIGPDEALERKELSEKTQMVIDSLTHEQALVLRDRFGFDGEPSTYNELAAQIAKKRRRRETLSRERVRQISLKAIRVASHPTINKPIQSWKP